MESKNDRFRKQEVMSLLQRFEGWDELKAAIEHKEHPRVEELVKELIHIFDINEAEYIKRTIEIRKDLVQRLRQYCVKRGFKQKQVVNLALDILLTMEDEV